MSPNLTANQCSTRYLRTLDPTLRRGVWTPEEDERLIAAVAGYGRGAWMEVANAIPGRTNEQCRDRWLSALDPTRGTNKDNEWDEAKDAALIEAVNTNGKKWKAISAQLGHPPTNVSFFPFFFWLRAVKISPPSAGFVTRFLPKRAYHPIPSLPSRVPPSFPTHQRTTPLLHLDAPLPNREARRVSHK